MTSQYPAKIDDNITLPVASDNSSLLRASAVNELRAAIIAIESCLGVNPASVYGTVRERLAVFETVLASIEAGGSVIVLGGDISGSSISQTVIGLQGNPVSSNPPTDGYSLTWSDTDNAWVPSPAQDGFVPGGDLTGTATNQTVAKINGTTPTANIITFLGTPSSSNLATAVSDETGSGSLVFGTEPLFKTSINLNNPGNTFKYVMTPAAIVADRILNIPLLTGTDTIVTADFIQSLTNKTIVAASNTITDTSASLGDILRFDGTRFARLARGSANQILTTNGGATDISWAAPAAPVVTSTWVTALDIDFTAESTQSLSTDTTYTIGGVAGWKKENSANDRVAMAITAGVGLVIQQTSSLYNATTRTSPLLWLPLSALGITYLDWDTSFRIWVNVGTESRSIDNTFGLNVGIDSDDLNWSPGWARVLNNGSNVRHIDSGYRRNSVGGVSGSVFSLGTWSSTTCGVLRCDIPKLADNFFSPMTLRNSTTTAWPTDNAAATRPLVGYYAANSTQNTLQYANASSLGPGAGLGIVIAADCVGGATNPLHTILNIRVDYKY